MKKYFALLAATLTMCTIVGFQSDWGAPKSNELFTIYLVRHSEKDLDAGQPSDPPLTACGTARSEHLSTFLQAVPLDAVYSTNYTRTKSTAQPTATAKKLNIEEYNPAELKAFAELLINRKQDALVVGHSNTTAVLAGMLVGEELGAFDLSIYNRVYQVVMSKDAGRLHLFHTAFSCEH